MARIDLDCFLRSIGSVLPLCIKSSRHSIEGCVVSSFNRPKKLAPQLAVVQLKAVRSLYHTSQQRNKQLEAMVTELLREVAKAHDGHRAQHAAADRLLALAAAAIAEGQLGQERVRAHEQHLATLLATVCSLPILTAVKVYQV